MSSPPSDISSKEDGQSIVLKCPHLLSTNLLPQLRGHIQKFSEGDKRVLFFDFDDVEEIDTEVTRELTKVSQTLKKTGKHIFTIKAKFGVKSMVHKEGLSNVFNFVLDADEAYTKAGLKKIRPFSLDAEFVNLFIKSTVALFETQFSCKVDVGRPFKKSEKKQIPASIAGIVHLSCDDFSGTISVCFPKKAFLGLYECMTQERCQEINEETQSLAGEIVNIIYGQIKTDLKAKGFQLDRTLPSVVSGEDIKTYQGRKGPGVVIPLTFNGETSSIEIMLDS